MNQIAIFSDIHASLPALQSVLKDMDERGFKHPCCFIDLDIHKEYFVAVGVNSEKEIIFGPQTAPVYRLDEWAKKYLNL